MNIHNSRDVIITREKVDYYGKNEEVKEIGTNSPW